MIFWGIPTLLSDAAGYGLLMPGRRIFLLKFHDVRDIAVENFTEFVNGIGTDAFIPFQTGQLGRTDLVSVDQFILRDSLLFHNFPQIIKYDHDITPVCGRIVWIITDIGS